MLDMLRLYTVTLLALSTSLALASPQNGYHYAKPTRPTNGGYSYQTPSSYGLQSPGTGGAGGHFFPPLATVRPLPVVPNLPPLPTARPTSTHHQQSLFQSHPAATPSGPTFVPSSAPHSSIGKIAQQYRPQSVGPAAAPPTSFGPRFTGPAPTGAFNRPTGPSSHDGFLFGSFAPPSGRGSLGGPQAPVAQPLRIPFGKSAIIHYPGESGPSGPSGPSGGQQNFGSGAGSAARRPVKQYAVIEIIDNDIMQNTQPFLPPLVPDDFRAHIGASGTGATPPSGGAVQINSRANANVLEQQRQVGQSRGPNNISLGSGGLGLVRLSNGNIHLGSGSLNYVSAQQTRDNANEARTRSEMARAGALHFGHGSLADSPIGGSGGVTFPNSFRF